MKHSTDMLSLTNEIADVEKDAVLEEQSNANLNYGALDKELKDIKSKIPYPNVKPYTTDSDYEAMLDLQYQKNRNRPFWQKEKAIELYCNSGNLYVGHVAYNSADYYIMENPNLQSRELPELSDKKIWLIEADDKAYANIVHDWRFPKDSKDVDLSRNIIMDNRHVNNVDVKLDKSSELFKNITDGYLRKALIRNRTKDGVQSIIQTIQEKQDAIRILPQDVSIIVQGCAGSGKTMVLLHRLRYMILNNDYKQNEYLFLVPGNEFKDFISGISKDFKINKNSILTVPEYYQRMTGRKNGLCINCLDELVFTQNYLARIYDENFIKDCYKEFLDFVLGRCNLLISYCEKKLESLNESIINDNLKKLSTLKENTITEFKDVTKSVTGFIPIKIEHEYDHLRLFLNELELLYAEKKDTCTENKTENFEFVVAADDYRILSDNKLNQIREIIHDEEQALAKANFFTKGSHRKKLSRLQEIYDEVYNDVEADIIRMEQEKMRKQAETHVYICEDVSLIQAKGIIDAAEELIEKADKEISILEHKLNNINKDIQSRYSSEIDELNELIVRSGDFTKEEGSLLRQLLPCDNFIEEQLKLGSKVFVDYLKLEDFETKNKVKDYFKIFGERTSNQTHAYLNRLLQSTFKRKIKEEFNIVICNKYKHYWYLNLYCNYLTGTNNKSAYKYVYIDEAQDLSIAELNLISKLNEIAVSEKVKGKPVMNLFGDIRQRISKHSIADWSKIESEYRVYKLDENFRNPNQIIEYCNKNLPFKMKTVGVDMETVSEYSTIDEICPKTGTISVDVPFIVKDDYAAEYLKSFINLEGLRNDIYTVKEVKGLEFKETYVFEQGMSDNEKYIAYTRALVKLNVVKKLPETNIDRRSLIIQGEEIENEEII